jgi:hypothetical protein
VAGYLVGIRSRLAATLTAGLGPGFVVVDSPRNVDPTTDPLVVLAPGTLVPFGTACPAPELTVDVWVVTPDTERGPGDDSVDAAADAVLAVLDAAGVVWTQAEPGTYADHPAWKITTENGRD